MSTTRPSLRDYVFGLQIIDTHEHLPAWEANRPVSNDVLSEYLTHYFSCDLVSAGLTPEQLAVARDAGRPLAERWDLVEPFWEAARNTGYGRSLDIAARDLYGVPRIDRRTIGRLNDAFLAARSSGQTYHQVLKQRSNIRISILDALTADPAGYDKRFFVPAYRLDDFVRVSNQGELRALAAKAGMTRIHTLGDLEEACQAVLETAIKAGACCLKTGLAYHRPLHFRKVARSVAEREFNDLFSSTNYPCSEQAWLGRPRQLADHMMHHICRLADRRGLVFQVHTGLQEGNGNYIRHADPSLLTNLFMEYPDIRFDCFHIGYPYQQTLAALAKNFRNVFVDFAWAHIISPSAAVDALVEYLDSVPANKISGFGGDYCFVDGVYGHQFLARENIVAALARKVDAGVFDMDRACELARMILHDNPTALFGLAPAAGRRGPAGGRRRS